MIRRWDRRRRAIWRGCLSGCLAVMLLTPALAGADDPLRYLGAFGEDGPGRLGGGALLTAAGTGDVYALNSSSRAEARVLRYAGDGTFILAFGSTGSAPGQFNGATDIAADATGNVYVADAGNRRVQKFTARRWVVETRAGVARGTLQSANSRRCGCLRGHER